MKKLLMIGLVLATGLFTVPAKADVNVHIGVGVPGVVIGTRHPHRHYHPPIKRHYHGPPVVRHYHGPPVLYYPERVYRQPPRHYGNSHFKHHRHAHPPARKHLRQGQRPLPPPHAHAPGHWRR